MVYNFHVSQTTLQAEMGQYPEKIKYCFIFQFLLKLFKSHGISEHTVAGGNFSRIKHTRTCPKKEKKKG